MAKKIRKSKKTTKITRLDLIFIGIIFVNFVSLSIHNLVLPWLYLVLVATYVGLYEETRRAPKIGHWLAIAYSPILVSLYYLDFALSCATLLVLGIANYYAMKERK